MTTKQPGSPSISEDSVDYETDRDSMFFFDIFSKVDYDAMVLGDYGWIILTNCSREYYNMFKKFLQSDENTNFPPKSRCSFIQGTIYVKSKPGLAHEMGALAVVHQFTGARGINSRLRSTGSGDILLATGSGDHEIGDENCQQPDGAVMRDGRLCDNVIIEVSSVGTTTRQLINHCVAHFECPNVQYVLGLEIMDFIHGQQANRQVRVMLHLFRRGVNDHRAPETVISFGNAPITAAEGVARRNQLINLYYPGYEDRIIFQGIGFDPNAPPCNAPNIPYYCLHLLPALLLQNQDGVQDNRDIPAAIIPHLEQIMFIDLFPIQRAIRYGFFRDGLFTGPLDV